MFAISGQPSRFLVSQFVCVSPPQRLEVSSGERVNACTQHCSVCFSPHLCVGFLLLILYPPPPPPPRFPPPRPLSVTRHLCHTIFHHTALHTSVAHNFVTRHLPPHHLSHTTLSHTIFHHTIFLTQLCTPLSHTTSSHTIFHHTIFHTQLCTHTHPHTHLLRTIFANSDVECILRPKTIQLYLTGMGRGTDPRNFEKFFKGK